jgi:hypothetical protein
LVQGSPLIIWKLKLLVERFFPIIIATLLFIAIDHFVHKKLHKPVVISPDAGKNRNDSFLFTKNLYVIFYFCFRQSQGGVYRARKFQQSLMRAGIQDVGLAMIVKQVNFRSFWFQTRKKNMFLCVSF